MASTSSWATYIERPDNYEAATIHVSPDDTHLNIGTQMLWLKEDNHELNFEQVKDLPLHEFTPSDGYLFSRGYTSAGYWFKFNLSFSPELINKTHWLLEIPFPLLDQVDLYMPDNNGEYSVIATGDRKPFDQRDIDTTNLVFSIRPEQQQNTYYLYVKTHDSFQVPLHLWKEGSYLKQTLLDRSIQGIYFGIMLVMVLYNFFIYMSIKDRNYLYYTIYISFFAIFQAGLQGISFEYFWPNNPWWANTNIPFFGVLSLFFAAIFARGTLNTRVLLPGFDKVLVTISTILFCTLPIILFADYDIAIYTSLVSTFIFFNLVLCAGVLAALKGNRTAKFFVLAWSIFLISGVICMLGMIGIIPLEYGKQSALQIGSALEVILLSIALADRINLIEKEKVEIETKSKEVLLESNKQLESSNRLKNEFIATISHEIRTPMNGVLGSTQLLLDTPLDESQTTYVNTINHSGKTLLEILNNILDYSKIEANKLNLELTEFNLAKLVYECAEFFSVISAQSNVNLYIQIHENTPKIIKSDPLRIKQILLNLLSNAFKFTSQGQIIVRILPAEESDQKILFEIEDSGHGLTYKQQTLLFQPFVQIDSSSTREKGGTGLGLAICKKLAGLLGGDIGVQSLPDEGATFWFTINAETIIQGKSPKLNYYATCIMLDDHYQESILKNQFQSWGAQIISHHLIKHIGSLDPQKNITIITNNQHLNVLENLNISKENIVLISNTSHPQYRTMRSPITPAKLRSALLINSSPAAKNHVNPVSNVPTAKSAAPKFSHLSVLAVDDNSVNRMIINKMLIKFGIEADVVNSGDEALDKIKQMSENNLYYDLILMDIEMPIIDGYRAAEEIRHFEHNQNIRPCRIVALTAHSMKESKHKALTAGMDGFLSKPIDQKALVNVLQMTQSSAI